MSGHGSQSLTARGSALHSVANGRFHRGFEVIQRLLRDASKPVMAGIGRVLQKAASDFGAVNQWIVFRDSLGRLHNTNLANAIFGSARNRHLLLVRSIVRKYFLTRFCVFGGTYA